MPLSPSSPQARGFVQIGNSQMDDIPLAPVKSNASSTGARKANQGLSTGLDGMDSTNEKQGFFKRRHAGRRKTRALGPPSRSETGGSEEISLNAMGRLYKKVIGFSTITRYLVYILPVSVILAVPLIVVAALGDWDKRVGSTDEVKGPPIWYLLLWIEVAWLMLWAGKIVAHVLPAIFMFFMGVVSSGTRKYATVLRTLEIPLSLFFWGLGSWLFFLRFIKVQYRDTNWVTILNNILLATFLSSCVFLGEKAIIQLISITYHQRSFANRIKDSKREIFLLGLLYDASRKLFPMFCDEFAEEDYIIDDSIEMMLGGKTGQRGRNNVPMRLIGNVGRIGDKVTSVFGNLASEITGKQVFNPNSAHSVVVEALEKVRTSEALAKRIWMSFVVEGNDALYVEDIVEVLGEQHAEDAEECFTAIDGDGNGDISLDEMVRKVVEISKERKAITASMKDIGQALGVFDKVLLVVVLIIVVLIFLSVFQSSVLTSVVSFGTALVSLSFAFSVTTQEFLGSCIFLFVKHPYDVGDRVDVEGSVAEQLVVEKISLLYTVFHRIDKMQIVQVPNIILNNLWIDNVTRSKAMKESIAVNVSFDTSFDDIEFLRKEMEDFVRHPDNARDFQPDLSVSVGGVGDLDKLTLNVAIKHKSNWHNDAVRGARRSKFMCALTLALRKVPILPPGGGGEPLGGPTNPSYSVAVSDAIASAAREQAARDTDDKRLVPLSSMKRSASNASRSSHVANDPEMNAANAFNASAYATNDDWAYNRDDNTLNSRSASVERKGSNDDYLHPLTKQGSGRRKPGESLPTAATHETPGISVTHHTPLPGLDEEAQVGGIYASDSNQSYYHQSMPQGSQPAPHSRSSLSVGGRRARGASVSANEAQSNNPYQLR